MDWNPVKRFWSILKDKIERLWDYLSSGDSLSLRLVPARAALRRPKARAPRADPATRALDPNRFQLD